VVADLLLAALTTCRATDILKVSPSQAFVAAT
jgi:hypothetical protein